MNLLKGKFYLFGAKYELGKEQTARVTTRANLPRENEFYNEKKDALEFNVWSGDVVYWARNSPPTYRKSASSKRELSFSY